MQWDLTRQALQAARRTWRPKTLPKSFQNASKNAIPTNIRFFSDFDSKKPMSQERRHRFRIGFYNTFGLSDALPHIAFGMDFGSKKPTKNLWKTTPEPFQNRCHKRVVFQHRFFRVSASIWEPLGPPSPPCCVQRQAC